MTHIVRHRIEFPRDIPVGYRAFQLLFQLPDLVQHPARRVLSGVLVLPGKESHYQLAVSKDPDRQDQL